MSRTAEQAIFEAEVDRLFGIYLRIKLLAQSRRMEVEAAGHEAAANGLIQPEDWVMVRQAITGQ